jgi:Protein of unknown function (DUF3037)
MTPYQFAILRYRHSVTEGELVNIGIVMWLPSEKIIRYKLNERYSRLSKFFAEFDGSSYRQMLRRLNQHFSRTSTKEYQERLFARHSDEAVDFLGPLMVSDDSCFQWSETMAGISEKPELRLEELYHELITRHETAHRERRDEDDIWQNVNLRLQQPGLSDKVRTDFEIRGKEYSYRFKACWQNGMIQVLEPISFDLSRPSDIVEKANMWSGRLFNLQNSQFKMTGIVSPPANRELLSDYERALRILRTSPRVRKILPESEIDEAIHLIQRDTSDS